MWWVRALEEWHLCGAGGCGASFLNALGLVHQGGCVGWRMERRKLQVKPLELSLKPSSQTVLCFSC